MIVVSGEALMDVFDAGATPGGQRLDARIGGSPLNVAIGLARLRQPVAFFGALSTDFLGERLLMALRDEGVSIQCVRRVPAPTTLCLVGLDARGVADHAFHGQAGADRLLPLQALEAVPAVRAYQFGSYAMVVEPTAATLRALIDREHGRALIAYDLNLRLNVEPDLELWRSTLRWMLPRSHLVKLSEDDLALLFPDADPDALAAQWLAQGVSLVVLTRGAAGALAWTRCAKLHVEAVPTEVIDTVGAGDSFQAALLAGLAERGLLGPDTLRDAMPDAIVEVLAFAAKAAAITCSRRGADPPRRAELHGG